MRFVADRPHIFVVHTERRRRKRGDGLRLQHVRHRRRGRARPVALVRRLHAVHDDVERHAHVLDALVPVGRVVVDARVAAAFQEHVGLFFWLLSDCGGGGGVERAASATSSSTPFETFVVVSFSGDCPGLRSSSSLVFSSSSPPRLAASPNSSSRIRCAHRTRARARTVRSWGGTRTCSRAAASRGRGHHEALEQRWPRVMREVEIALALVEAVGFLFRLRERREFLSRGLNRRQTVSGFFVVIRIGALFARAHRVLPGRGVLRASSSGKKAGGRRDARGGAGWPSVVYSSTRRSTTRLSETFLRLRVHSQRSWMVVSFRGCANRAPNRDSRVFDPNRSRLRRRGGPRATERRGTWRRTARARASSRARRLVSMRPARSRREPTGRLDAATRAGPSRVLGRSGSITRTDARRGRRRGGTRRARVEFRAGGAEHTHRAEHVPPGRGHEAET